MPIKLKLKSKQNNNNIKNPRLRPFSSSSFRKNKIFDDNIIKMCANGLVNIGATCYMNATLQCLAHVENLTKYLLKIHKNSKKSNKYMLTNAYKEVIYNLWENKNIRDYSPDNFKT
jgi:ubiquitin C-terminal hydrolase